MVFVPAVKPAGDGIAIDLEDVHELIDAVGFGTEQNGMGTLASAEDGTGALDVFETGFGLWVERGNEAWCIGHGLFLSGREQREQQDRLPTLSAQP